MGAFLGISLWIALATVVPGLVTIAVVYGANAVVGFGLFAPVQGADEWIWGSIGITVMVLTQALGILLEDLLVRLHLLGPATRVIDIPEGIDPENQTQITVGPYDEYRGMYLLLAELSENDDAQGHLKRALAQFFLTNNTLVSFTAGIVATILFMAMLRDASWAGMIYIAVLILCLAVSFNVARIRFDVMTRCLWAARRSRITREAKPQ